MPYGIYLSPSLQEANIGVGNYGSEERVMNLIADSMTPHLLRNEIAVYRNTPNMTRFQARDASNKLYAEKKIHVHLALHSDAGGGRGTTAYTSGSVLGFKFTKSIYDQVAPLTPSEDRGIRVTKDLTEVITTKAPACLIEIAYHDRPEDASFILDHIPEISEAIVKGICDYFNIAYIPKPTQKLYRVQVGAFRDINNARKMKQRLNDLGIEAFIVE